MPAQTGASTPSTSTNCSPVSGHAHDPSPDATSGFPARPAQPTRRAGVPTTIA